MKRLCDIPAETLASIKERWTASLYDSFPAQTATFLRQQQDRFRNPMGHALRTGAAGILDTLAADGGAGELAPHVDEIVKVRAVQDLSPSASLRFIFQLKRIVREELGGAEGASCQAMEEQIDELALQAFDVYVGRRERICELRVDEIKRQAGKLFERMNRFYGPPDGARPGAAAPDAGQTQEVDEMEKGKGQ